MRAAYLACRAALAAVTLEHQKLRDSFTELHGAMTACQSREATAQNAIGDLKWIAKEREADRDQLQEQLFNKENELAEACALWADHKRERNQIQEQVSALRGALEKSRVALSHLNEILREKDHAGIDIEVGSTALKSLIRWGREADDILGLALAAAPAAPDSAKDGGSDDYGPNAPFNSVDCRP